MKVNITQRGGYGDRFGAFHAEGSVADLPEHIALKLLRHGIATAVRERPIERAVVEPPEKTAATRTRRAVKHGS